MAASSILLAAQWSENCPAIWGSVCCAGPCARCCRSRPLFGALLAFGQTVRPLMPAVIKNKIPQRQLPAARPDPKHERTMILLEGCAQPSATPATNAAAARVLDRLGISVVSPPEAGCCGAVSYHLGAHDEGLECMRRNIDAWEPLLEEGAEAIIITASGCGSLIKEYGHLLRHDPVYADKAQRISERAKRSGRGPAQRRSGQFEPAPGRSVHRPSCALHLATWASSTRRYSLNHETA